MEHEPFDNDLFDPPPKQHKQQQQQQQQHVTQSAYQQPYAKQQQQQQRTQQTSAAAAIATTTTTATSYLSATKNATGHTNMPSSISGSSEIRTSKQINNNTELNRSPYTDYQYSPKSLPVSHIVQSGSYVEILKQGGSGTSTVGNAFTPVQRATVKSSASTSSSTVTITNNDISPTHQNQKRHQRSIAACHNKSYGDFLTITPRRKGNKLVIPAVYDKEHNNEDLDDYHHHHSHHVQQIRQNLPHSIEPLHLLGISDEKNYTFLDYRAMEAISNADTLEMGSSISGNVNSSNSNNKIKIRDRYNEQNIQLSSSNAVVQNNNNNNNNNKKHNVAEVSTEYQYFMREKNLSPPTAFSDNILLTNNTKQQQQQQ